MSVSPNSLVNHTPHSIRVYHDNNANHLVAQFPPVEPVIRLNETPAVFAGHMACEGGAVAIVTPPKFTGLSHAVGGPILVSMVVAQWLVDHPEEIRNNGITAIYSPDTGPEGVVRNVKGDIVGTTRLVKWF